MSSYYEKNKLKLREYHRKRYYEQKEKQKEIKKTEKTDKNETDKTDKNEKTEEPYNFSIKYKKILVKIP